MANAPIQVILNPENFRQNRVTQTPKSAGTDFFQGRNDEFSVHQQRMQEQVRSIHDQLRRPGGAEVGYLKVSLRSNALAKSHRPFKALFTEERAPVRGSTRLGEIITEMTPSGLAQLHDAIGKAETEVREKPKKGSDEMVPAPTRYRCEVSALDRIELWTKADRRKFDLSEAIRWLSDPRTGQAYTVELFEMPPQQADWNNVEPAKRSLFNSFYEGLRSLGAGLVARCRDNLPGDSAIVEVQLTKGDQPPAVLVRSRATPGEHIFDPDGARHQRLIGFLEAHPLVRYINLPSVVVRSIAPQLSEALKAATVSVPSILKRDPQMRYPVVGVIDGGVSKVFDPWVLHRYGFLAPEHESLGHGSFISGLLVEGSRLNASLHVGPDGCLLADLNVFPDENQSGIFEDYFPNGAQGFFDEIETAVAMMRREHGVRIFNFSLNLVSPVMLDRYSLEAQRLDKIADDHDVIFVVSAGNLEATNMRREWPADDAQAAAILAGHRQDQLFVPAESIRNISVAAINPPGLSNAISGAPARYTRRGPGLKTGVKPDLCHVGGSGTVCPVYGHGLLSRAPSGNVISGCGTSYAAPLVARTLGALDSQIEGEPSRETLMALALHHSQIPAPLQSETFKGLARQLIGFGMPSPAAEALAGGDHQITLLFSSRIYAKQTLVFGFTWPPSLVMPGGKCRGDVRLTLVSTPPVDYRFGDELVRVNIEATLQQEGKDGKYKSSGLESAVPFNEDEKVREANLIEHMFKWSPVKLFSGCFPRGRGESSNWRLSVNYLTRAGEEIPKGGIPLSILLTIADPDAEKPVFQEMRQSLQANNYKIADIRTAARITPRV